MQGINVNGAAGGHILDQRRLGKMNKSVCHQDHVRMPDFVGFAIGNEKTKSNEWLFL